MPAMHIRSELRPRADASFSVPSDLIAAATICLFLTVVAVAVRTFVNAVDLRRLRVDDYAVLVAGLCFVAFAALMFVASQAGLGSQASTLSADAVKRALLYSNILDIMYTPIMLAAKVAILVQVDRMFSGNKQRLIFWSVRALAYLNAICYTVMFFTNVFVCTPRAKIVDPLVAGKCIPQNRMIITSGTVNITSDVLVLLFAVWGVSRLQLNGRRQTMVALVFSIGSFACIASVCRLAFGVQVDKSRGFTQAIWPVHMWSLAEITAIIYIACCPAFPRLIQYLRGTKTPKPSKGFKSEKDIIFSEASSLSSAPNTPDQKFSFPSPVITPPTPPNTSPKTTPPPTPPHGFPLPPKRARTTVRFTLTPTQTTTRHHPPTPPPSSTKPARPLTSYHLPATALAPQNPNFSHPQPTTSKPTSEKTKTNTHTKTNTSSLAPRPIPTSQTASLAASATHALETSAFSPCEKRISPLAYTSRHTAAINDLLRENHAKAKAKAKQRGGQHKRELSSSSSSFVPRTPLTPATPATPATLPSTPGTPATPATPSRTIRDSLLAPPASPDGTPLSPVSPARTEFSVALVESAVRMRIMPVYFARRRVQRAEVERSASVRGSVEGGVGESGSGSENGDGKGNGNGSGSGNGDAKKHLHSFRRSRHSRGASRALGTHLEV